MDPAHNTVHRFAAFAFAVMLALGSAAAFLALSEMAPADRAGLAAPSRWWAGEAPRAVARAINEQFPARREFHRFERGLAWLALRDWGPRVREGCSGWLFLADELEPHAAGAEAAAQRARIAARVRERLARRGIALEIVAVPDKSRIESGALCGLARPAGSEARLARWVEALRGEGVDALDLTPVLARLPGERYYRTDTHWNEAGAEAAAHALAQALRRHGVAGTGVAPPALAPRTVARPGDLVRLAGLDALPAALRPADDVAELRDVPAAAAAGDDLFAASAAPQVVLVGTSYSRTSNFAPFLARHLGGQVANAAKDGGDFDGAARAWLASAGLRDTPPRVLVWEVPERVLEAPLTAAERRWLAELGAP
jgi:alginate O-acetyltransferase complex protein AlgJ